MTGVSFTIENQDIFIYRVLIFIGRLFKKRVKKSKDWSAILIIVPYQNV